MMKMNKLKTAARAGFTLIELMIAMTILSSISLGIYDATTGTFKHREKTEEEGDFYNSLRVAMDVIGRDVAAFYTPQPAALPGDFGKPATPNQPGQPQEAPQRPASRGRGSSDTSFGEALPFWDEPINQNGVRPSRLQGEESRLSFISNSHMRLYKDSAESDFAKISYRLEDDKNPEKGSKGKVLIKREDPAVFTEDDRGESETEVKFALIGNVKALTFEYLDGEKDTWSKKWDTASADHKGVTPAIIRVTLEIYLPNSESTFVVTQQFRQELQQL